LACADLHWAIHDGLAPLLDDLVGDERNVLLTLARMLVTLQTGEIVSKDQAADRIMLTLAEPDRAVLELAAAGYLGERDDDWSQEQGSARQTALHLAAQIRAWDRS
jgi:streptomycin 3"-adenylyltransferase